MNQKALLFQTNIQRSLREQWSHIESMMNTLPEGEHLDWDNLDDEHKATIDNIKSIEAEWIMDDDIRKELTVLQEESDD